MAEREQCQARGRFGRCPNLTRRPGYPYCRKHAEAKGYQQALIPTSGARVVIEELKRAGWSHRNIACEAGLGANTITDIMRNPTMHRRTAEKLLALRDVEANTRRVQAWPYQRRLRSLQAAGHTGQHLSQNLGIPMSTISFIVHGQGEWIARRQAEVIDRYWREHAADPVSTPSIAAKRGG